MKKMVFVGIVAAALTAAGTAQAAPALGLWGDSGLARTPMTVAQPPMTLAVAGDFIASDDAALGARAEFGVIEGLEVGAHYWYFDAPGDSSSWGLNAKYVFPQFVENLGLAVGGHYREQNVRDVDNNGHDFYAAASYPAGFLVPTVGIKYESLSGDNDDSDTRFFGSLVANILPTFALGAEIMTASDKLDGTDADPVVWFGARFLPIQDLTIQAGMLNYANFGGGLDNQKELVFHCGAQYAFSFRR